MLKLVYYTDRYQTKLVDHLVYPGGEVSLKTDIAELDGLHEAFIDARIENSDDFFALALLKDVLDSYNIKTIDLKLDYVPYARQDRVIPDKVGNQALSIKVFANMLNALNFTNVSIADPHSTVTPALINNCIVYDRSNFIDPLISPFIRKGEKVVLFAPDVGAIKSVGEIAEKYDLPWTFAIKKRDPETGYLKIVNIPDIEILHNAHVVVLDDIADGSMTFNLLSQYIKSEMECIPLSKTLYVTHGIFSKGLGELLTNYDTVATYNLFDKYYDLRKDVPYISTGSLKVFGKW